jgi:hypothetical protein
MLASFFQFLFFFYSFLKITTMKRLMYGTMRPLAGLVMAALLFTACKKDDTVIPQTPVAGLMAFNLAPDKPAVGFALSGNNLANAALGYTNYTGVYLPIFTGTREVRSFDYGTGSTLALATGNFADSNYYSVFLLGANGSYRNVVVKDALDTLKAAAGKAWVRYVNAIADSTTAPKIIIGSNGESVINENAAYGSVSNFAQIRAGAVNTSANNGGSIVVNRTITLEENKIYTVLFTGIPNQTDSAKVVQIKFIQNGTVTP